VSARFPKFVVAMDVHSKLAYTFEKTITRREERGDEHSSGKHSDKSVSC